MGLAVEIPTPITTVAEPALTGDRASAKAASQTVEFVAVFSGFRRACERE
jgi:hypothetical protein